MLAIRHPSKVSSTRSQNFNLKPTIFQSIDRHLPRLPLYCLLIETGLLRLASRIVYPTTVDRANKQMTHQFMQIAIFAFDQRLLFGTSFDCYCWLLHPRRQWLNCSQHSPIYPEGNHNGTATEHVVFRVLHIHRVADDAESGRDSRRQTNLRRR